MTIVTGAGMCPDVSLTLGLIKFAGVSDIAMSDRLRGEVNDCVGS